MFVLFCVWFFQIHSCKNPAFEFFLIFVFRVGRKNIGLFPISNEEWEKSHDFANQRGLISSLDSFPSCSGRARAGHPFGADEEPLENDRWQVENTCHYQWKTLTRMNKCCPRRVKCRNLLKIILRRNVKTMLRPLHGFHIQYLCDDIIFFSDERVKINPSWINLTLNVCNFFVWAMEQKYLNSQISFNLKHKTCCYDNVAKICYLQFRNKQTGNGYLQTSNIVWWVWCVIVSAV